MRLMRVVIVEEIQTLIILYNGKQNPLHYYG